MRNTFPIFFLTALLLAVMNPALAYVPGPSIHPPVYDVAAISQDYEIDQVFKPPGEVFTPSLAEWSSGRYFTGSFGSGKALVPAGEVVWIVCQGNPVNYTDPDGKELTRTPNAVEPFFGAPLPSGSAGYVRGDVWYEKAAAVLYNTALLVPNTAEVTFEALHVDPNDPVAVSLMFLGGVGAAEMAPVATAAGHNASKAWGMIGPKFDWARKYIPWVDEVSNAKNAAWQRYKGKLSYKKWSKKYDVLQENRIRGKLAETVGEPGESFMTPYGRRFIDNAPSTEIKTGYASRTKFIRRQILKDCYLRRTVPGFKPYWEFQGKVSSPLRTHLESMGVSYKICN